MCSAKDATIESVMVWSLIAMLCCESKRLALYASVDFQEEKGKLWDICIKLPEVNIVTDLKKILYDEDETGFSAFYSSFYPFSLQNVCHSDTLLGRKYTVIATSTCIRHQAAHA